MNSRIYTGTVWHERSTPRRHAFRYRVFMPYLDLAELPALFDRHWLWSARRPALAWFRRADHLGEATRSLDECVRDEHEAPLCLAEQRGELLHVRLANLQPAALRAAA